MPDWAIKLTSSLHLVCSILLQREGKHKHKSILLYHSDALVLSQVLPLILCLMVASFLCPGAQILQYSISCLQFIPHVQQYFCTLSSFSLLLAVDLRGRRQGYFFVQHVSNALVLVSMLSNFCVTVFNFVCRMMIVSLLAVFEVARIALASLKSEKSAQYCEIMSCIS